MREIATFPRDDHYLVTIAMWACDVCTFTGCLMDEIDKVSLDMTSSDVLTIAIVFKGLSVPIARFHRQSRRGLMGETNVPV